MGVWSAGALAYLSPEALALSTVRRGRPAAAG
jgi:hypothetical protein